MQRLRWGGAIPPPRGDQLGLGFPRSSPSQEHGIGPLGLALAPPAADNRCQVTGGTGCAAYTVVTLVACQCKKQGDAAAVAVLRITRTPTRMLGPPAGSLPRRRR